ncbi:unnamed protein product [Brassica rapa subsp. trilocularis]
MVIFHEKYCIKLWFLLMFQENFMPTTQDRGINGRRNLASNYTDANKGRSRAFKRQSGANHIIRGLKTASPAPNKAIKDTSNPVIPLKCTSSSKDVPVSDYVVQNDIQYAVDGTSKSSQQDQWLLPLLIAVASQGTTLSSLVPQLSSSLGIFSQTMMRSRLPRKKAFIAVKKSTNSFAVWCHTRIDLAQGGTGVKASIDELHVAACLTFDKSDSHRLVHRLDRDCSGLLVLGRTQTAATLFHCIFLEKTSGASAYVKPLLKVDRFQHAITEYRVIEFSPLG